MSLANIAGRNVIRLEFLGDARKRKSKINKFVTVKRLKKCSRKKDPKREIVS
jgi:hypothetical protein